jgi:hypothetical protein
MTLLQLKVDDSLKKAMDKKADMYGVPVSTLVRIVLVRSFIEGEGSKTEAGNIFNAEHDNQGKGIKIDDLIASL